MIRNRAMVLAAFAGAIAVAIGVTAVAALQQEYKSGIVWPEPKLVTPGKTDNEPPSDAIVLFDGKDLSKWNNGDKWKVKDGYAVVQKADITTKDSFGDYQLHVEFATPEKVSGSGQGRGNSGVFLANRYEVQVLDSYDNKTYFDGQCGEPLQADRRRWSTPARSRANGRPTTSSSRPRGSPRTAR